MFGVIYIFSFQQLKTKIFWQIGGLFKPCLLMILGPAANAIVYLYMTMQMLGQLALKAFNNLLKFPGA